MSITKTNPAKLRANQRYNAKFERVTIRMDHQAAADLRAAAAAAGMSVNAYTLQAITARMEHDKQR